MCLPPGELDLPLCVSSGQVFRWQPLPSGAWLGVDGPNWYLAEPAADRVTVRSNASQAEFDRLFRLDWSAAAVEAEILAKGPELQPYLAQLRGLRVLRPADPEETFFCFLCTPNNNVARITQMVQRLAEYGDVLDQVEGVTLRRFPPADVIAGLDEGALRAQRFGYRAGTIVRAARALLERGEGWLESLKGASYDEAHRELVALPYVGPKLADCIALFGLHLTEAVPVDTHLWQQVVRLYRPEWAGKSLTEARYREAGDLFRSRFGKLAGWAHQYLFYDNLLNWRARRTP